MDEFLVELIAGIIDIICHGASKGARNFAPDTFAILTGRPVKNRRLDRSVC